MKKVILLLALGFFTFSATSLMAQTPKVTNTQTQVVDKEPTRVCTIKKPAKGKVVGTKGHIKCTSQSCTKTGKCAKGCQAKAKALHPKAKDIKAAHARSKTCCTETPGKKACNHAKGKGKQTLKPTSLRIERDYQNGN